MPATAKPKRSQLLKIALCTALLLTVYASTNAPAPQANEPQQLNAGNMQTWLLEGCQGFGHEVDSEHCDSLELQYIELKNASQQQSGQPFNEVQQANAQPFEATQQGNRSAILLLGAAALLALGVTGYVVYSQRKP